MDILEAFVSIILNLYWSFKKKKLNIWFKLLFCCPGNCEGVWEFKSKWTNQGKGVWKAESLCSRSGKNKTQRKLTISNYIISVMRIVFCVEMYDWDVLKGKDITCTSKFFFQFLIAPNIVKYSTSYKSVLLKKNM